MSHLHSVAVFCGSSVGNDPAYGVAATALGEGLAAAGIRQRRALAFPANRFPCSAKSSPR